MMTDEALGKRNEELAAVSADLFGDAMRLMVVKPESLTLLKDNARFFKRETFRQLRDNIAADKRLSSVPLCYRYPDGKLEVLSGNHRVQASIEAGIPLIMVLVSVVLTLISGLIPAQSAAKKDPVIALRTE